MIYGMILIAIGMTPGGSTWVLGGKPVPNATLPITNFTQTNLGSNQCPAVTGRRLNS
jgi:hypothetical protein